MAFAPNSPDITPSPLSERAQTFINRLVLQSQYDCRQELDLAATKALKQGVRSSTIDSTVIHLCRIGNRLNQRPDVIQRQIESSLAELHHVS